MNRGPGAIFDSATSPGRAWSHPPAWILFLSLVLLVLTGDLWLKSWAFAHVAGFPVVIGEQTLQDPGGFWRDHAHPPVMLVPGILSLHLMTNQGAVFGLGQGGRWFFIAVSLAAAVAIPLFFIRSDRRQLALHVALALILGGALGNLYDRMVYGCVRDMLWLFPDWGIWPWIFNLADAALMIGVGLVMLTTWFSGNPRSAAALQSPPAPPG